MKDSLKPLISSVTQQKNGRTYRENQKYKQKCQNLSFIMVIFITKLLFYQGSFKLKILKNTKILIYVFYLVIQLKLFHNFININNKQFVRLKKKHIISSN